MNPKISVIVPVYNTEKYLHRCIDSILTQIYTDFELLLINDGSTDSSGTICDENAMRDSRVRVFHKENGGVSSARNRGLREANGKYIMFADSDDTFYPNSLLDIQQLIEEDNDLVVCKLRNGDGLQIKSQIGSRWNITPLSFSINDKTVMGFW